MNLPRHLKLAVTGGFASVLIALSATAYAHNNPTFREDLLVSISIENPSDNGVFGQPFTLNWDKKTVQLIWRIEPQQPDLKFSIAQNSEIVLQQVEHDQATARLQGENFTIVNVTGAQAPFAINVFAKVLDRSKQKKN